MIWEGHKTKVKHGSDYIIIILLSTSSNKYKPLKYLLLNIVLHIRKS